MEWRYKDIMERGSEELKSIIAIITKGYPPGKSIKEEQKDETISKETRKP